jgi:hypothetical protein
MENSRDIDSLIHALTEPFCEAKMRLLARENSGALVMLAVL